MIIWSSFVKMRLGCSCEFKANSFIFCHFYPLLFDLETIIWWLIFEKRPFQFWREIWIWVLVILLLSSYWMRRLHKAARSQNSTFTFALLQYWKKAGFKKLKNCIENGFLHVLTTETKQRENYSPLHFCILNFGFTQNAPWKENFT